MTEGRPPKDASSSSEPESGEQSQDGRRSQTRSVAGRKVIDQPAGAPRATFSPAQSPASKPAAGANSSQASRSAFQYTPGGQPPTSSDPDKTVRRPYPTNPSTWGQTLRLGDPVPTVPEWPQFLQGCVKYRQSLDEQAADAPRTAEPPPRAKA